MKNSTVTTICSYCKVEFLLSMWNKKYCSVNCRRIAYAPIQRSRITPTKISWLHMKERCLHEKSGHYKWYGARGIKVCNRWLHSFKNFLADMGEKPQGLSLDRINNNGNYEPSNCKWSTWGDQANNKRNNIWITFDGKTLSKAQWAREINIDIGTLANRIYHGWSISDALTTHVKTQWNNREAI